MRTTKVVIIENGQEFAIEDTSKRESISRFNRLVEDYETFGYKIKFNDKWSYHIIMTKGEKVVELKVSF